MEAKILEQHPPLPKLAEIRSLTWDHVLWLRRLATEDVVAPLPVEEALSALRLVALDAEGGLVVTPKGRRFLAVSDPRLRAVC